MAKAFVLIETAVGRNKEGQMKKRILIGVLRLLKLLYGGASIRLGTEVVEYMKKTSQGEEGFLEDCDRCKELSFCLTCPGFKKLYERNKG